jgi:ABC-2 type transport system ATP-binding protein
VLAAVGAAVLVVVVGSVVTVRSSGGPEPVAEQELRVDVGAEPSGEAVALDVSVFTPSDDEPGADDEGRRPAVVLAHGFGGSKAALAAQARTAARDGYVVLTYTARGFGDSGGRIHLDSPDYEIADVSVLLDLLAERDDVELDGDGDPRVGIAGGSYGGAVALMAAAYDDRVDAIVPAITWNDLSQALFPQSATSSSAAGGDPGPGVFKRRWASLFFAAGIGADRAPRSRGGGAAVDPTCGRFDPTVCGLYREAATTGRPGDEVIDLLKRSSPAPVLDRITAPTLILQGEQDSLFPLDQGDANARGIATTGTPVAVRWVDGGHDAGGSLASAGDFSDQALGWFDHYLRDGSDPGTAFEFTLPASPFDDDAPEQLTTPAYGESRARTLALAGDDQGASPHQVASPPRSPASPARVPCSARPAPSTARATPWRPCPASPRRSRPRRWTRRSPWPAHRGSRCR